MTRNYTERNVWVVSTIVTAVAFLADTKEMKAQCTVVPPPGVDVSSSAYQQVVAEDDFCCNEEWDDLCQLVYDALSGGGGTDCTVVPPPGVDVSSSAYQQVVSEDDLCCNEEWDDFCQEAYDVLSGGGTDCTVVPPPGVDVSSLAYQQVVAADDLCCNEEWDQTCQEAYDGLSVGVADMTRTQVSWSIYPNPGDGDFTIAYAGPDSNALIEVIDLTGRQVHAQQDMISQGSRTRVALAGRVASGTYIVRVVSDKVRHEMRIVVR